MKKLYILFSYFSISLSIAAQKTPLKVNQIDNFCSKLSEIMGHAHTNFEKIKKDELQVNEDQREDEDAVQLISFRSKASLKFPDATLSSICPSFGREPDSYEAYFGKYPSMVQAERVFETIKNRLAGCLKDYKVEKILTEDSDKYPLSYVFDEKRKDKIPPHKLDLSITKDLDWGDEDTKEVFKIRLTISGLGPVSK